MEEQWGRRGHRAYWKLVYCEQGFYTSVLCFYSYSTLKDKHIECSIDVAVTVTWIGIFTVFPKTSDIIFAIATVSVSDQPQFSTFVSWRLSGGRSFLAELKMWRST